MTIKVILHDDDRDRKLSFSQSRKMVESFWKFCHNDCCGTNVDYQTKEFWFMDCHSEHYDDEQACDTVEWEDFIVIFGRVL